MSFARICAVLGVGALVGCGGGHGTHATNSGTGTTTTGTATSATIGAGTSTSGTTGGTTSLSTSAGTSAGTSTGGCPTAPVDVNGACSTTVDCLTGLVCTSAQGGGICVQPVLPNGLTCLAAGHSCGGSTEPVCCGICLDAGCVNLADAPCTSIVGAPCQRPTDCCHLLECVEDAGSKSCQPSCGQLFARCDPTHGNADCCLGQGYTCRGHGVTGGAPYACENYFAMPPDGGGCVAACTAGWPGQCELGSQCAQGDATSLLPDNCQPAGLVCNYENTCVLPSVHYGAEVCMEGGPPCTDGDWWINSRATPLCTFWEQGQACTQLCRTTSDCNAPAQQCCTTCNPPICKLYDNSPTCGGKLGQCNSQGLADGVCAPYRRTFGADMCLQATVDGGRPGSACDDWANRQNPAFCDTSDLCLFGICSPVCNAGTGGDHPCPAPSRQQCTWILEPPNSEVTNFGVCMTLCDPSDGGGCAVPDGGVAQVCLPDIYGYGAPLGFCVAQRADPLPVGAPCAPALGRYVYPSPCVAGAICQYNLNTGGNYACDALCQSGSLCADGTFCRPFAGTPLIGVCIPGS